MLRFLVTAAATALGTSLCAQGVPYGDSIISVIVNNAPSEGLWLADRAGNCSVVSGLSTSGSAGFGVSAVRMDPIDDRIWLAGTDIDGNTARQLNWIRINGSSVVQFDQFAILPVTGSQAVNAITFDDNANPIVVSSTAANGGGVFRVDRASGVATLIGSVSTGTHNAITKDDAGNLYIGMFSPARIYRMTKNPDCTFQSPVLIATVPNSLYGITFVPANTTTPDELWTSGNGPAGNMMFRLPTTGGAAVAVANALPASNWVEYDRRFDDVLRINAGLFTDTLDSVDRTTGTATLICSPQGGNAGGLTAFDANDGVDHEVVVAPMCLNGSVGPFTLELGVTVPPGNLAIVGEVTGNIVLGFGLAGPSGRVSVSIPSITAPAAIAPGSFQFVALSFDPNGVFTVGAVQSWPSN